MVKLIDGGELVALQEENNRLFIENKALVDKLGRLESERDEQERLKTQAQTVAMQRGDELTALSSRLDETLKLLEVTKQQRDALEKQIVADRAEDACPECARPGPWWRDRNFDVCLFCQHGHDVWVNDKTPDPLEVCGAYVATNISTSPPKDLHCDLLRGHPGACAATDSVPTNQQQSYAGIVERLCSKCRERPVAHEISSGDLCCRCYVAAGNPPADWHSGCMAAVEIPATKYEHKGAGWCSIHGFWSGPVTCPECE